MLCNFSRVLFFLPSSCCLSFAADVILYNSIYNIQIISFNQSKHRSLRTSRRKQSYLLLIKKSTKVTFYYCQSEVYHTYLSKTLVLLYTRIIDSVSAFQLLSNSSFWNLYRLPGLLRERFLYSLKVFCR